MNRALWFVAGAASGVYTLVKAKRTAQQFTPDGIAGRMAALSAGARVFADEVSAGMREREAELRADIRTQHGQHRSIEASRPRQVTRSTPSRHEPTARRPDRTEAEPNSPEGSTDGHR